MPAGPVKGKAIGALDARQSDFLIALLNKESWDRSAIDELASTMNLLPDGALDAVNEACFELVGEPLWEGDDRIQVNLTVGKEMLTCQTN
jgi:TerB-C domain